MKVTVNMDALTVGDLRLMDRAQRNEASFDDVCEVLQKAIDVDIDQIKLSELQELMTAVTEAVTVATNPEGSGGN